MIRHVILMSLAGEKMAKQFVAGRHDTEQTPAPRVHRKDGAGPDGSLFRLVPGGRGCLSEEAPEGPGAQAHHWPPGWTEMMGGLPWHISPVSWGSWGIK